MRSVVGLNVAVFVSASYVTTPTTCVAPWNRVNVVALIVAGFIGWLNDAVGLTFRATLVAFAAGVVKMTVGGSKLAPVVNIQVKSAASPSPPVSCAPVVILAV